MSIEEFFSGSNEGSMDEFTKGAKQDGELHRHEATHERGITKRVDNLIVTPSLTSEATLDDQQDDFEGGDMPLVDELINIAKKLQE
jgi:hypothetical protein